MAKQKSVSLQWYGDDLVRAVKKAEEPGLWAMGNVLLREAEGRAPKDSGRLRRSGYVATTKRSSHVQQARDRRKLPDVRQGGAVVAFAAWYSNLIEDTGATRHDIPYKAKTRRTKARKVLLIPGIGYRTRAEHKGFKRRPFLGPALEAVKDDMVQRLAREMEPDLERAMP